jgi:hypothetical protein
MANVFYKTGPDTAALKLIAEFFDRDVLVLRHEGGAAIFRVSGMTNELVFAKLKQEYAGLRELVAQQGDIFVSFIIYLTPRGDLSMAYFAPPKGVVIGHTSSFAPPKGLIIGHTSSVAPPKGLVIGHHSQS